MSIDIHLQNKKDIDQKSLMVYELLMQSFNECQKYSNAYKNITGVFFHDLMRILTALVYKIYEKKNELILQELKTKKLNSFPYIDFLDINANYNNKIIDTSSIYFNHFEYNWKANILKKIINYCNPDNIKIGLTDTSLNFKTLIKLFWKRGYNICYPNISSIFIPNYDNQIKILQSYINKITNSLDFKNPSLIQNIIEKHIISFTTNNPKSTLLIDFDLLIVGTTCDIHNRLLAIEANSKSIPVVFVNHGEADGLLNEPVHGYGEYSYGNYYLGYGNEKNISRIKLKNSYLKPLYSYNSYFSSSSEKIGGIYNKNATIKKITDFKSPRFMYVPTSLSGFNCYGPYRSLSDCSYKKWHNNLIKSFPNLIVKVHYKGFKHLEKIEGLIKKRFELVLDKADVFIFDYVSTALTIAIATNKPIVFFNLGINNITDEAEIAIRNRCIWIDIEEINDDNLYSKVLNKADQKLENTYTEKFCITNTNQNREEILIDIIDSCFNE